MTLSERVRTLKQLLETERDWLDDRPKDHPKALLEYSIALKELRDNIHEHKPFVYSSLAFNQEHPELYEGFVGMHEKAHDFSWSLSEAVERVLEKHEAENTTDINVLRQIMDCCRNNQDEGNYFRARNLHDEEAKVRTGAIEHADEDFLKIKNSFYENDWEISDIPSLENMLEDSDLLVEKGRFLEDSELVYHGAELSNQMVGVLNNLKRRRTNSRRAIIGLVAGVGITALTLIQPYTPIEPVKEAAKEFYQNLKDIKSNLLPEGD